MKYKEEDVEELITHAKNVGDMAGSLMKELANKEATNWGLVNDTLCGITKALHKLGHTENRNVK